ncbi:MAG: hypothetical protein OHK0017_05980 [Patescibacteria group bacterium]
MAETTNTEIKKPSWVKQLYYYVVLGLCILFLSIGSYIFLRSNLVKYVFTELGGDGYSQYESQCMYPPVVKTDGSSSVVDQNSPEYKNCISKAKEKQYQSDMLTSILQILIAGVVLFLHLRFIKLKE